MLYNYMLELGYTKEEIKLIIESYSLNGYGEEKLYKKVREIFEFLLTNDYDKIEIIRMTKTFPSIYGLSIENMKQKIEYYDKIELHDLAIIDTKKLMQSVDLSYARYEFYKEKGIIITIDNYRKLFVGQKQFEKKYEITKKELLEKYNYEKYMEEQKNGHTL